MSPDAEDVPPSSAALPRQSAHDEPRTFLNQARRRLGEVLVGQGLITTRQLAGVLARQADAAPGETRKRLGTLLVEDGLVSERHLAAALAEALGLDLVDLPATQIDSAAARLLPRAVAERHGVLVISRTGNHAVVAAIDPTNVVAIDDARIYTGATELTVHVAPETELRRQLARAWSSAENAADIQLLAINTQQQVDEVPEAADIADAPVVRLVADIFADAVRLGASDIHVEPQPDQLRVRYRVDGVLRDVITAPRQIAAAVISRIKVTSGLDIAERRRPQDGRTALPVDGRAIDARVSTLPTMHGEKVVIRLLTRAEDIPSLAAIGIDPAQLDRVHNALHQPQGLVLITGPTGSGKTNTLYAGINELRSPEINVVTLEDPVEILLPGISQMQVNERSGLTFARGLRSVLRQDPDVVLVGEVRDHETAELALQASLTGHLVLTTLHTNDAVAALTRLVDMGAEPFLVASSLTMVIAQRLVRRVCTNCAAAYRPEPHTLAMLGLGEGDLADADPKRGAGCSDCGGTGYHGRTGIFEVLPVTAAVRRVLLATPTEEALRSAARSAGMVTLRASGLAKAARGETTYEDVLRVTQVDSTDRGHCPNCDRGLADDMVVCPWCATPVDRGRCVSCARPLEPAWAICPWCRTPTGVCHHETEEADAD